MPPPAVTDVDRWAARINPATNPVANNSAGHGGTNELAPPLSGFADRYVARNELREGWRCADWSARD